jgi:DNA-binding NarL/FixJ family response regulator
LRHILSRANDCEVVGDGATSQDALLLIKTVNPHVMLLDADLPGGDISTLHQLAPYKSEVAIILLSNLGDEERITRGFKAGARGFVRRATTEDLLFQAVRSVHQGRMFMEPEFASILLSNKFSQVEDDDLILQSLTAREEKVLRKVAQGLTNKEIARTFQIAEKTVKHHMTKILQKLTARNRVDAAMIARERFGWQEKVRAPEQGMQQSNY